MEKLSHYSNSITEKALGSIFLGVRSVKKNRCRIGERRMKERISLIQNTIRNGIERNALKSVRELLSYSVGAVLDAVMMLIGELSKLTMLMVEDAKNIESFVAIRNCLKTFRKKEQGSISYSVLTATKSRDMKITKIGNPRNLMRRDEALRRINREGGDKCVVVQTS